MGGGLDGFNTTALVYRHIQDGDVGPDTDGDFSRISADCAAVRTLMRYSPVSLVPLK